MAISTESLRQKMQDLCQTPRTRLELWDNITKNGWPVSGRTFTICFNRLLQERKLWADGENGEGKLYRASPPPSVAPLHAFPFVPLRSFPRVQDKRAGGWNAERAAQSFFLEDLWKEKKKEKKEQRAD